MCLLTVNGRCTWSTCPEGSLFDSARRRCVCERSRIALGGACLTLDAANRYCGKGSHFENGGCTHTLCPAGLEMDQETGYCLNRQQTSQVASNMGVQINSNQKLGCPPGEQLVIEGQQAACVPAKQTCTRDESWDGKVCRKTMQCPPGSGYDEKSLGCLPFTVAASSSEYTVDLPTWVRTTYGEDGGDGTVAFCGAFNKHPLAFGVRAGSTLRVKVSLEVQAPGQKVSDASALARTRSDPGGQEVPAKGNAEVQQAAQSMLSSLVAGGGKSSTPAASTSVSCQIVNSSAPTAVTVTGGA
jgi:hypothetical protein